MRKREGIEPRYYPGRVDADALTQAEGKTKGAKSQGSGRSTGVLDRGASLRRRRELGRSHELLGNGVGRHNRQTGRKPDGSWEVGSPHSSEEVE